MAAKRSQVMQPDNFFRNQKDAARTQLTHTFVKYSHNFCLWACMYVWEREGDVCHTASWPLWQFLLRPFIASFSSLTLMSCYTHISTFVYIYLYIWYVYIFVHAVYNFIVLVCHCRWLSRCQHSFSLAKNERRSVRVARRRQCAAVTKIVHIKMQKLAPKKRRTNHKRK